ncbi:unnamed protein product [Heligmosomoides polygyrus]|uniref:HNH endonuclease n=1 Tax=Heligmosomoides polygyrus TaxID=6339 RepID=A0A183GWG8_HELPZ|nr:unnamed protein product [Heligmosomoides polygyrus]
MRDEMRRLSETYGGAETVRRKRSELEYHREAKKKLEHLSPTIDTQGTPRIIGTEAKNSVKGSGETKTFHEIHRDELRTAAPQDGQLRTQPGHEVGRST